MAPNVFPPSQKNTNLCLTLILILNADFKAQHDEYIRKHQVFDPFQYGARTGTQVSQLLSPHL